MRYYDDTESLAKDDPDRLENCGLSKLQIRRLGLAGFFRFSDLENMSDIDLLREPGINGHVLRGVQKARARRSQIPAD